MSSRRGAVKFVYPVALLAVGCVVLLYLAAPAPSELEGPPVSLALEAAGRPAPPGGVAQTQELSWLDEEPHPNPYLVPQDLYLFWGSSAFKGHGATGRVSSAQRVRQVLGVGHFTGNQYVERTTGHDKYITDWDGAAFRKLSRTCCVTLVVPPMESDLPIYDRKSTASRNIRFFVANGNRLVLTGGSYLSIVFANMYESRPQHVSRFGRGIIHTVEDRLGWCVCATLRMHR